MDTPTSSPSNCLFSDIPDTPKNVLITPNIKATINPEKIAMPPNLAMGLLCILLESLGISTAPILNASFLTIGVAEKATINARAKRIIYS